MNTYHKIQTIFKRNPETKFKTLLEGEYSLPEFKYLKDNKWIFTEKVDGTNIRIMFQNGKIMFGGKTDRAQIPNQLVNRLNEKVIPLFNKFVEIFNDTEVCLYGEGYGAKIQKIGSSYGAIQDFVLFDIKIGHWWLQRRDVEDIADKLNLDVVPIVGSGTLEELVEFVKNGFDSKWGNFFAEGIVARPETELVARNGRRIITKLKYKDFKN
jgi:ATP-dependent RNA circularization protein (DNA/RNA ligase family)